MLSDSASLFGNLIGSMAVIIVVAGLIGGSDLLEKITGHKNSWINSMLLGIMGGVFGIYGNLSGMLMPSGALVTIRDIGPMLSGLLGGPMAGLIAGAIAGAHRMTLGGITAQPCMVATCLIGIFCGCLSRDFHDKIVNPAWTFTVGAVMELMHLALNLSMIEPLSLAVSIVRPIAVPFVLINATGLMGLIFLMQYIDKQKTLELERSRIRAELEAASVIQRSLLPSLTERYPGRSEISIYASMDAAKEIGGDFYDVFFLDSDHLGIVMADVSGKGIPAALFMANSKQTIQSCVRDIPDLSEAVAAANSSLCGNNDAEMFVTAWIGVLDLTTGTIDYVNAGHDHPVIISGGIADYEHARSNFVLAGMEDVQYKKETLQLRPGDKVFLYTDGVTEAENAGRKLYGSDRLLTCLAKAAGEDASEIIGLVKEDVARHVNGHDQFDDMTMMCLGYTGSEK